MRAAALVKGGCGWQSSLTLFMAMGDLQACLTGSKRIRWVF